MRGSIPSPVEFVVQLGGMHLVTGAILKSKHKLTSKHFVVVVVVDDDVVIVVVVIVAVVVGGSFVENFEASLFNHLTARLTLSLRLTQGKPLGSHNSNSRRRH